MPHEPARIPLPRLAEPAPGTLPITAVLHLPAHLFRPPAPPPAADATTPPAAAGGVPKLLLTIRETCQALGVSQSELTILRQRGELLPLVLGPHCIRYSVRALEEWIAARRELAELAELAGAGVRMA